MGYHRHSVSVHFFLLCTRLLKMDSGFLSKVWGESNSLTSPFSRTITLSYFKMVEIRCCKIKLKIFDLWDKIEQDRFQFIFLYIYTLCGYHRHACRYETMIYIKFIRRFNRIKHSHTHSNLSFLRKVYSCHEIKDYVYCFFLIFIFTGCLQILELKKSITCMRLNESNQWKSLQQ